MHLKKAGGVRVRAQRLPPPHAYTERVGLVDRGVVQQRLTNLVRQGKSLYMWPRQAAASRGHIYKELPGSSTCSRLRTSPNAYRKALQTERDS